MGLGIDDFRFILSAKKSFGLTGNSICTLGHLTSFVSKRALDRLLRDYNLPPLQLPKNKAMYWAEDYLEPWGFKVTSLDASKYEGAAVIHDLNKPVPDDLIEKFDLVVDGGTLEHVFNFPMAIENAMKMVKIGGHLILVTPANNQCGHGFYQFSPELFYRILSPGNGFELLRMYITAPRGRRFHVVDPAQIHGRVQLLNSDGAYLMVHAKKLSNAPLGTPQQSDYLEDWDKSEKPAPQDGKLKAFLRKKLSPDQIAATSNFLNRMRIKRAAFNWKRTSKLSNRRFYVPVTDWSLRTRDAFAQR